MECDMTDLRLAVQTLLVPGRNLEEQFQRTRDYGFDAIEIAVGPNFDLGDRLQDVQQAARNTGLPVAAICTHPIHDPLQPDAAERARRFAGLRDLVLLADEIGARGVVSVPLRPARGFASVAEQGSIVNALTDEAVAAFTEWANAMPTGPAAVFIEPLNRSEAFLVNRVGQAADIARRVGNPRVLALADLFHMNIEERHLGDPLRQAGDLLGHVHIADNNRLQPGKGCLDLVTPFTALAAIGYDGYVSIECFSPAGPTIEGDPDIALPESARYMRDIWTRVQATAA
jgi:sugar phosphate isomerase/epimerase